MRFTIRDLLLATALAGVLVAWWIDHVRQAAANHYTEMLGWRFKCEAMEAHLERVLGNKVTFGNDRGSDSVVIEGTGGIHVYYGNPLPNLGRKSN